MNRKCMNRKGISAVVATVLIILITVAAVTIVWTAIVPMINKQLDEGTVCFDALTQLSIENKGYTCWDDVNSEVRVQVAHGYDNVSLIGLQILIYEGGSSTSVPVGLEELPGLNENRVLNATYTGGTAESVSVAPIIRVGNSDKTCDALDTVELDACLTN